MQTCLFQGLICVDNCACCHSEIEVANPPCYFAHPLYPGTGPNISSIDPAAPGTWQGDHFNTNLKWLIWLKRTKWCLIPGSPTVKTDTLSLGHWSRQKEEKKTIVKKTKKKEMMKKKKTAEELEDNEEEMVRTVLVYRSWFVGLLWNMSPRTQKMMMMKKVKKSALL